MIIVAPRCETYLLWCSCKTLRFSSWCMYERRLPNICTMSSLDTDDRWIETTCTSFPCSPPPLQHICPSLLSPSVFWQCAIILGGPGAIGELSDSPHHPCETFIPWPPWRHLHHSNTDEQVTAWSPNTHNSWWWISADFEPSVTRNFISTCCCCTGVNRTHTVLNYYTWENSWYLQIPPPCVRHIQCTLE